MNYFNFQYPVRQHFGKGCAEEAIKKGMPTRWSEMGITDETVLRKAADTCIITPGCCRQMSRNEIFEALKERL